jgi:SAM-dependent methyltransferase
MNPAEKYWNEIYEQHLYRNSKAPLQFLQDMLPRLRAGKTLDIAMGEGVNAAYLAQKGFQVKGFDISTTAVDHAKSLAQSTGMSIEANRADLDLFMFGMMEYDTIVMTYFKPPVIRYYNEIIRALKMGGTLLIESATIEENHDILSPNEPWRDWFYKPNELLNALRGLRILFYHEGLSDKHHVVQLLAVKPTDKDVAKYDLFNMQSSGPKESGMSAQQKLAESLFKKK